MAKITPVDISTLEITPQMLQFIAEIDEFKGAWRALGTLAPERLTALRKVATIESIGSSTRIEGAKLSDRQIETLLSNIEQKSLQTRDEQEVAGYAEVMGASQFCKEAINLSFEAEGRRQEEEGRRKKKSLFTNMGCSRGDASFV